MTYNKKYYKENKYRVRAKLKGRTGSGVILRFKDRNDADDYFSRTRDIQRKDLGYVKSRPKKKKIDSIYHMSGLGFYPGGRR